MTVLLSCLLVAAIETPGAAVLQAGRDVPMPKRTHYVEPTYPDLARQAGVSGVVIVEITLKEDGRPTDISVIQAQPLLDLAALEAARLWQYEPTLVDGSPRRVVVRELVEVFPDKEAAIRYFAGVVESPRQPAAMRIVAARRLLAGGVSNKTVVKALERAARDKDPQVSQAASDALRGLKERGAVP